MLQAVDALYIRRIAPLRVSVKRNPFRLGCMALFPVASANLRTIKGLVRMCRNVCRLGGSRRAPGYNLFNSPGYGPGILQVPVRTGEKLLIAVLCGCGG